MRRGGPHRLLDGFLDAQEAARGANDPDAQTAAKDKTFALGMGLVKPLLGDLILERMGAARLARAYLSRLRHGATRRSKPDGRLWGQCIRAWAGTKRPASGGQRRGFSKTSKIFYRLGWRAISWRRCSA